MMSPLKRKSTSVLKLFFAGPFIWRERKLSPTTIRYYLRMLLFWLIKLYLNICCLGGNLPQIPPESEMMISMWCLLTLKMTPLPWMCSSMGKSGRERENMGWLPVSTKILTSIQRLLQILSANGIPSITLWCPRQGIIQQLSRGQPTMADNTTLIKDIQCLTQAFHSVYIRHTNASIIEAFLIFLNLTW